MSHATHTSSLSISQDEIHDLLVNGEESLVILDDKTPATLRNIYEHTTRKVDNRVVHEFKAILTLETIYEHSATVNIMETKDKTEFRGSVSYQVFQGGPMSE